MENLSMNIEPVTFPLHGEELTQTQITSLGRDLEMILEVLEDYKDLPDTTELGCAVSNLRRDAMQLNTDLSRLKLALCNRIAGKRIRIYTARLEASYESLAVSVCEVCSIAAPEYEPRLEAALGF